MLPIVCVRMTWPELLVHAWVFYFIDNDAVKAALVSGNTKCFASMELLSEAAKLDMFNLSKSWHSWVPSPSNISDGPSRMDFTELEGMDESCRCEPIFPNLIDL